MTKNFNIEDAIKALQSGQDLTGKDGVLTPLIKQPAVFKIVDTICTLFKLPLILMTAPVSFPGLELPNQQLHSF